MSAQQPVAGMPGGVRMRLIGTPEDCGIALARLRDAFTSVTPSKPLPCRGLPGRVRVYVEAVF